VSWMLEEGESAWREHVPEDRHVGGVCGLAFRQLEDRAERATLGPEAGVEGALRLLEESPLGGLCGLYPRGPLHGCGLPPHLDPGAKELDSLCSPRSDGEKPQPLFLSFVEEPSSIARGGGLKYAEKGLCCCLIGLSRTLLPFGRGGGVAVFRRFGGTYFPGRGVLEFPSCVSV